MRVAAYVRHSGNRDQMENLSLATQERLLRDYAARQGLPEPEVFAEKRSAYTDDLEQRPIFARLVAAIERGEYTLLLIYDQDRLARDAALALMVANRLTRAGCRIVLMNQPGADVATPDGKFMYTIGAGVSEYYSSQISRKSRAGLAHIRANGGHVGGLPYGARRDDDYRLVVDPARAEGLRLLLTLAAAGSSRDVAEALNRRGIPPPQPRTPLWRNTSVQAILQNGRWLLDQPAPWPALWLAARGRAPLSRANKGRTVRELSGLLRCACGGVIIYSGYHTDRATGARKQGLHCRHWTIDRPDGARCPHRKTYADHYHALATAALLDLPDLTRVDLAPLDVRAARAALQERRLNLARAVAMGLPRDEAEALELAIVAEEAALPLDAGSERARAEELLLIQWSWATRTPEERNEAWRRLVVRFIITGRELAPEWQPPIARLLAEWRRSAAK